MKTFEPIQIGNLRLDNRLVMAPVKTAFAAPGGMVTDRLINYYRRRAEGGVGAIIVEPMFITVAGKEHPRQLGVESDERVEGLRRLVDAIHSGGARAIAHLNHAGRAAKPKASGMTPEAPSAVKCPTTGAMPDAMATGRIKGLVADYASAARRARTAGFDAIELQFGLGYLMAQFISERTNQRDDAYGGSAERRLRFPTEVVTAVRSVLQDVIPVTARISAAEKVEGGLTSEDAIQLARWLESHGIAAIHVATGSACDSPPWYFQHVSLPEGINQAMAAEVKKSVEIPVIAAGRLGNPDEIMRLLDEGVVDLVGLGRPLVADPDLPHKLRDGKADQVVQCGGCLQGCLAGVASGKGIGCIVNPELGNEGAAPAADKESRHVVVVGGGPAGLTAARVAAGRGHRVTLLERNEEVLGGQFALAHLAPGKQGMRRMVESLVRVARQSGAEVQTGTTATAESLAALEPDVVLVGTGAEPIVPPIPGLAGALTGEEVLTGSASVGKKVLVVGGGLVGIEVAEFLAEQEREVVVVEMLDEVARDMLMLTRKMTLKRLASLPVTIHTQTKVTAVSAGQVTVEGPDGERELGSFDSVVVAVGTRPLDTLSQELAGRGVEVHVVGDARELGQVQGAVRSAWEVASQL